MSEQWWAVKTKSKQIGIEGVHLLKEDAVEEAQSLACFFGLGYATVIPVRIVEEDAEPCEWEHENNVLSNNARQTNLYFMQSQFFGPFKFCPMCGRKLEER